MKPRIYPLARLLATFTILINLLGLSTVSAWAAPDMPDVDNRETYQSAVDADLCISLFQANIIDVNGDVAIDPDGLVDAIANALNLNPVTDLLTITAIITALGRGDCGEYDLDPGTTDADATDGDATDADATDGDATDADATDADATDADATDADATDGDATDADATDADATDADATDADATDADATDADATDADATDGDATDADATDADATDADATDGDATDADATDGDATDADATDADATDADATDADATDADATDADATDADATDGDGTDPGEGGATLTILKVDSDGLPLAGACFNVTTTLGGANLAQVLTLLGLSLGDIDLLSTGCDADDGSADGQIVVTGIVPELIAALEGPLGSTVAGLLGGVDVTLTLEETVLPDGVLNPPGPITVNLTLAELLEGGETTVENEVSEADATDADATDADATDADATDADATDADATDADATDGDATDADATDADATDADATDGDATDADATDADATDADATDADATDGDATDADATDADATDADADATDGDATDADATDGDATDADATDADATDADATDADATDGDATDADATDADATDGAEVEQGTVTIFAFTCENLETSVLQEVDETPTAAPGCTSGEGDFLFSPATQSRASFMQMAVQADPDEVALNVVGSASITIDAGIYEVTETNTEASVSIDLDDNENLTLVFQTPASGQAPEDGGNEGGQQGDTGGTTDGKVRSLPTTGTGETSDGFGFTALALISGAVVLSAIGLQITRRQNINQ